MNYDTILNNICDRIEALLSANHITVEYAASHLGTKSNFLTAWKTGKASPTITQIIQLCDLFHVSADFMLRGKPALYKHEMLTKDDQGLFLEHLLEDTLTNMIYWSRVGSWGDGSCRLDFRSINPVLNDRTSDNPFVFNNWRNMFVTEILTGFVYLLKHDCRPTKFSLFLQTDCHAKIAKLNINPSLLRPLYAAVLNQLHIKDYEISCFLDQYHNSHCPDSFE